MRVSFGATDGGRSEVALGGRGGMLGGAYDTGPAPYEYWPGCTLAGETGASSGIFAVGATRTSECCNLAPHPPQNRESGVFSVPHVGQRIPLSA
jgi:hypothetical protein